MLMTLVLNVVSLLMAYLLGSIPTAVWISRYYYGIDIREYGSGNAGATNTFRVLGKKAGIPVLIVDIAKGWFAVKLAYLGNYEIGSILFINLKLVLGAAAILGHIFPVFAGFRGGKGIATLLGIILAVHPYAALVLIGIFLIVMLVSGYVSLSSMVTALLFPVVMIVIFKTKIPALVIFSLITAILVLITHQKNIERLIRREESKTVLLKRKGHSSD